MLRYEKSLYSFYTEYVNDGDAKFPLKRGLINTGDDSSSTPLETCPRQNPEGQRRAGRRFTALNAAPLYPSLQHALKWVLLGQKLGILLGSYGVQSSNLQL